MKYKDNSRASEVLSASDYFDKLSATGRPPFGKQMAGRNYSDESYRYGFNGKENDKDFGNQHLIQDYGFRLYNPEIGKFLSVDPLAPDYPWNSTYAFAENRVIDGIDLEGAERKSTIGKFSVDFGYTHGSDHVPYTQHTENIEYALKVAPELEQQEAYRIAYERWRNSPAYKIYMKKRGYHEYDGQWYPNGSIVPVNIEYEAIELAASFGLGKAVRKGVQWGLTRTGNEMLEYAVRKGVPEKLQKRLALSIVDPEDGNSPSFGKWPWKKTTASVADLTVGGGNCKMCADKIQKVLGGDIIKIKDKYGAPGIGPVYTKKVNLFQANL
ncbi:RHS repeat-associated core domain-containing protein [Rapidithrix thailandica]|uniref:RHS repeat-associated core domain-containing protein n=1 Tax=Rapidithrix thailandica TaxID=413964 RepID=A0AAW9S2T5_9BACT